jgi:hypothetical protein
MIVFVENQAFERSGYRELSLGVNWWLKLLVMSILVPAAAYLFEYDTDLEGQNTSARSPLHSPSTRSTQIPPEMAGFNTRDIVSSSLGSVTVLRKGLFTYYFSFFFLVLCLQTRKGLPRLSNSLLHHTPPHHPLLSPLLHHPLLSTFHPPLLSIILCCAQCESHCGVHPGSGTATIFDNFDYHLSGIHLFLHIQVLTLSFHILLFSTFFQHTP